VVAVLGIGRTPCRGLVVMAGDAVLRKTCPAPRWRVDDGRTLGNRVDLGVEAAGAHRPLSEEVVGDRLDAGLGAQVVEFPARRPRDTDGTDHRTGRLDNQAAAERQCTGNTAHS